MYKFKVGDRIRFKKEHTGTDFGIDDIKKMWDTNIVFTVEKVSGNILEPTLYVKDVEGLEGQYNYYSYLAEWFIPAGSPLEEIE